LKCYGRLWILLDETRGHAAELDNEHQAAGEPFDIQQSQDDGSLTIRNVAFRVYGDDWTLSRPLNARSPWPLYAHSPEGEEYRVFTQSGDMSDEFLKAIKL